jgi:hypothetical protein
MRDFRIATLCSALQIVANHEVMRRNRVFKPFKLLHKPLRRNFTDATSTARAAGHNVLLHVETELLRQYFISALPDDDGIGLVSLLIERINYALEEKLPTPRESHGEWLGMRFGMVVQHRRRPMQELLQLQILMGPCTADAPAVFVLRTGRSTPLEEPPF